MLHWPQPKNKPMNISTRHLSISVFIAILLHVAVAAWFSIPEPKPKPEKKLVEKPPLKINLLAQIAEKTINTTPEKIQPAVKEKKQPVVKKKVVKKVKPVKKPAIKSKPIEEIVETKPVQEVIQPPTPVKNNTPLDAVATARYEQLLVAWLEQHKKYPRRAKRLRIEGEGQLRIIINRSGHTQQVSLAQRTGNRLLDKAALEMVQRATPFPAMPENDPRQSLEFIVPVAFLLN
jgi:periplasmic protein TonB